MKPTTMTSPRNASLRWQSACAVASVRHGNTDTCPAQNPSYELGFIGVT